MRHRELLVLLCAAALVSAGCANKQIVRASPPPSVADAPTEAPPPVPAPLPPPATDTKAEPPPEVTAPPAATLPTPAKRPVPRRPAAPETAEAAPAPPKPAPPQISPQLSARDLAKTKSNTTSNITTAEKNVQATTGKQLNAAQNDLVEKINGFLTQAHEAIVADDWVRASNLADKARVLSLELAKSF
jgi:hypothetical protein